MEKEKTVDLTIEPSGLVVMKFLGDLLEEQITSFASDLVVASIAISHLFRDQKKKVKILLDMTDFSGKYTAQAMEILTNFAKQNTPFVEKTASYGGSEKIRETGEIIADLAQRKNIKIFATKEEAMAWLES